MVFLMVLNSAALCKVTKWRPSLNLALFYSSEIGEDKGTGLSMEFLYPLDKKIALNGNLGYMKHNDSNSLSVFNPNVLASMSLYNVGKLKFSLGAGLGMVFYENGEKTGSSMNLIISDKLYYYFSRRWGISVLGEYRQPVVEFKGASRKGFWGFGFGLFVSFYGDKDKDGIPNDEDVCYYTPPGAKVNSRGCGIDSDGDGVYDGVDKCKATPFAAIVDKFGCPMDSDNDGVFDGVDLCEGTPEGINVDSLGCPDDADEDGIPDFKDSCASTPENAIVDKWGCPSDSDQDGIFDGIDECPNTPTGFEVDKYGCPSVKLVSKEVITDLFDNNLNLTGKAAKQLELVAERIYAYPKTKYTIDVYTDTEGSAIYNLNRSNAVANKVKQFLLARGVKEHQIAINGRGKSNPIMLGFSEKAKIKNRRVEINRIIVDDKGEIHENN